MAGKKHWGTHTFKVTERTDRGRYGYCTVCLADMQAFKSQGYRPLHYASHKEAKSLGLWPRKARKGRQ